ncbi:hypothetical protein R6Q57_013518 [Mikania cordata]
MKHIHSPEFNIWLLAIVILILLDNAESLRPEHRFKKYGIVSDRVKLTGLLTRLWTVFSMSKGDDRLQVSNDRVMSRHL